MCLFNYLKVQFYLAITMWLIANINDAFAADLILVAHELPPFSFLKNGEPSGSMIEMVKSMCKEAGQNCSIKFLPWRRAVREVEMGRAQGIFPIIAGVKKRQGQYFELQPLVKSTLSFVVPQATSWTYEGGRSLNGKTIVVSGPSGTSMIADEIVTLGKAAHTNVALDNGAALRELANGRLPQESIILCDKDLAFYSIESLKINGIKISGDLQDVYYTIGLSQLSDQEELINKFTAAFTRLNLSEAGRCASGCR